MAVTRQGRAEIFEDASGQWRYRLVAPNGEVIGQSEAYTRKSNCKRAARRNTNLDEDHIVVVEPQ